MNIKHSPLFDTQALEETYTKKDGIPVKYVCTSATSEHAAIAADIFYRETPHPEFGNYYFGIYRNPHVNGNVYITDADMIETLEFGMLEGPNGWEYSQHRHDYRHVGDCAVDGGRSYFKRAGDLSVLVKYMKVVNGEFVEVTR